MHAGGEAEASGAADPILAAAANGAKSGAEKDSVLGGVTVSAESAAQIAAGPVAEAQIGGAAAAAKVEVVPAAGRVDAQPLETSEAVPMEVDGGVNSAAAAADADEAAVAGCREPRNSEAGAAGEVQPSAAAEAAPAEGPVQQQEAGQPIASGVAAGVHTEQQGQQADEPKEAVVLAAAAETQQEAALAEQGLGIEQLILEQVAVGEARQEEGAGEQEEEEEPLPAALSEEEVRLLGWHWANLEYGCSARLDQVSGA
jgi:hypothetical protein